MGKRIEVIPYRKPKVPKLGAIRSYKLTDRVDPAVLDGIATINEGIAAITELAHKRALKAKHQRNWRAKTKAQRDAKS